MTDPAATAPPGPSNLDLIRRLLALGWSYRGGCLLVLLYQIVLVLFGILGLWLIGLGFDVIRHQVQPASPAVHWPLHLLAPSRWPPRTQLWAIGASVLVLAAVRALLSHLSTVELNHLVQQRIVVDLRSQVYDKLQRLSFRFFDGNASGSIINRVTSDVQGVRAFVDGVIMSCVTMVLSLVLYLVYMLALSPGLTLACLAPIPVLWLATAAFSRLVRPEYKRNRELYDQMLLDYTESMRGMQVTKGFAREAERHAVFARSNAAVRDQQGRIFWRVSLFTPTVEMLPQFSLVILLLYGGSLVMAGQLPLGTGLVVFIGLLSQFSAQISSIANITNTAQQSLVSARRVFEVLDSPVEVQSPPDPVRPASIKGTLVFQNVHFQYKDGEEVLREIDLEIPAGSCLAILGATGAGKSTLLSLIPRFYDPLRGRVLLDGTDVRRLDLDRLRRSVSLVFQESFLFSNTIAANIAFGHPEADQRLIERAARLAQAHDFISELPEGYQTVLGESGITLSGGQRQRLAIARAVLLEPPIMLLDDPTAAIDAETEQEILAALDSAILGRTTVIVAHRLSTLRRAQQIVVLERGRIIERGSHDQLLALNGHYARSARLQLHDEHAQREPAKKPPGTPA